MTTLEWVGFAGAVLFCLIMLYVVVYSLIIILTNKEDE